MDVEVVQDQDDLLGIGVVDIHQVLDAIRPVIPPPVLGHLHVPLALERLRPPEDIDCSLALVFIVFPRGDAGLIRRPWTRRQWLPDISQKLDRALVETDLGSLGIIGTGVDIQDILHVPAELSVLFGWDTPLLLEMG